MAHIASAVLARGASSLPNSSGNTPLHWALQNKWDPTPYTLYSAPFTLHSSFCTLHPTPSSYCVP
jgi:hypothetical protein